MGLAQQEDFSSTSPRISSYMQGNSNAPMQAILQRAKATGSTICPQQEDHRDVMFVENSTQPLLSCKKQQEICP